MSDTTPAAARHGARAAAYAALAGVFRYPDAATVAELSAPETRAGLAEAGATLGLAATVDPLCDALADPDPDRLRATYTRLFGLPGDGGEYPVVPYEAHYTVRDDIGQRQRRIAKVAGAVDALGFEFADGFDERQDHVAVELELLQVLAARRAVAARGDDAGDGDGDGAVADVEATLLADHLVDFVPPFAAAVRDATGDGLYRAAADLAEALVTADHGSRERPDRGRTGHDRTPANGGRS